jgi:hypothetical protein
MLVLRDEDGPNGSRSLSAYLNGEGDLIFEGRDYGKGVDDIFGYTEYEWYQTIRKKHLEKLCEALGNTADLMSMIEQKFSGEGSSNISSFLEEHGIPVEFWSRVGD